MFYTPITIPAVDFRIKHEDNILSLGSCFAENIGEKLQDAYFSVFINPFGVLYNPVSVAQTVCRVVRGKEFSANDLFRYGSLWHSFAHSGAYSAITPEETLQKINSRLLAAHRFVQDVRVVLITLGTAWIFEDVESGKVVANCHKLPSSRFNRRRLGMEEVVEALSEAIALLRKVNPQVITIFSVSPIRHWKDGAHENTLSKSTLHVAVDELLRRLDGVHYFPAFEILLDELRDYRYYASDMLHPSAVAVDHIWQRFSATYFSDETNQLKSALEQLRAAMNHRPLHPETTEYRQFASGLEKKKIDLIAQYPFLEGRL